MTESESTGRITSTLQGAAPAVVRGNLLLKVAVMAALVLALILASGGVVYGLTGDALQSSTEQRLTETTKLQAASLAGWDQRMQDHASYIAAAPEVGRSDIEAASPYLEEKVDSLPGEIDAIHVVDRDSSTVLASSDADSVDTRLDERGAPWAAEGIDASKLKPVRTDPYTDPVVGGPAVAYVVQVDGMPDRALVLVVDLAYRSKTMKQPSRQARTVVVNAEDTVVMNRDTERIGGQFSGGDGIDSDGVRTALTGTSVYEQRDIDGKRVAAGYYRAGNTGWVAVVQVPLSSALALKRQVLASIGGMMFVAFLALGAFSLLVGRGVATDISSLAATARELESGDLDAHCSTTRSDEIGDLYRSFEAMRDSLRTRIREAEGARSDAESAREHAESLNAHLESKAEEYSRIMGSVGAGDLTQRMNPESRNEAMTEIAVAFNEMMGRIEGVVDDVARFADQVAASSEEVTASSEEIQRSSDAVAASVSEIADGAERQDETLQSVAEEMNSLSTTIEEIASSASEVADVAEQTATTGDEARGTAEQAIEEMADVEREADTTVQAMEDLQDRMEQIEEITEFITDVAEQTNILALNANIEAARAGEAGEGFAVVADEVKSLAEETREAAEEIDDLVGAVLAQTERTADEVRDTSHEVGASVEAVERTVDALEEIAGYAEETNAGIQEISDATADQAASTNHVGSMVDKAASIAEQTAAEASTAAGATQQQAAALDQMTENAGELAAEADQLRETLGQFETDSGSHRSELDDPVAPNTEDD